MVSAPFATNNTVAKREKLPENGTVIRKLSFVPQNLAALSLPIAAQILRCRRGRFFQRCKMEYDDSIVRQMVECIKVYPGGKLEIIFGGGYLVEESV